jgi:hypothetical protein
MAQVKRKHAKLGHLTKLIEQEVSFFNGWHASERNVAKACEKAAKKILRYLGRKR